MANGNYRVNFGNGQVSHSMRTKKEALAYIAACKSHGGDPYCGDYFVQHRDAEGFWMGCR